MVSREIINSLNAGDIKSAISFIQSSNLDTSWAMRFSLNELNRMRDLYPNDSSEYRRYTEVIAIRNHGDAMHVVY